jgi:hypothetical protein
MLLGTFLGKTINYKNNEKLNAKLKTQHPEGFGILF